LSERGDVDRSDESRFTPRDLDNLVLAIPVRAYVAIATLDHHSSQRRALIFDVKQNLGGPGNRYFDPVLRINEMYRLTALDAR